MSHLPVDPALLTPSGEVGAPAAPQRAHPARVQGPAFDELLLQRTAGVQFSGHALQRIQRRGIALGAEAIARLNEGVTRASGKGARESVVFVDGTAFVVSVRNQTVITAVDRGHMRDHVFTNIDSAVIA